MKDSSFIPKRTYSKIHALMPIACVDLAIFDSDHNRILLLKRLVEPDKGKWWVPGGRIRKGETFRRAVRRIALGEIGLAVRPGPVVSFTNCRWKTDPFGHGKGTQTVSFVLLCRLDGHEKIRIDRKHIAYRWWNGLGSIHGIPPAVRAIYRDARRHFAWTF